MDKKCTRTWEGVCITVVDVERSWSSILRAGGHNTTQFLVELISIWWERCAVYHLLASGADDVVAGSGQCNGDVSDVKFRTGRPEPL